MSEIVLYHGTTREAADVFLADGWRPRKPFSGALGNQCGDPALLYLTTEPENALWYAEQKCDRIVLEVRVNMAGLVVDPEDGVAETVVEEISNPHGLPGNLAAVLPLPAESFSEWSPSPRRQ